MTDTRFTTGNPDEVSMGKLFKALGPDSLKKTVFALTFANNAAAILETEAFQRNTTEQWPKIIAKILAAVTKVTSAIRVVPVGYYKESIPSATLPGLVNAFVVSMSGSYVKKIRGKNGSKCQKYSRKYYIHAKN